MEQNKQTSTSFLPDFCGTRMVFVVVLLAELLAIVLTLAQSGSRIDHFYELAIYSMFIQWLALACVASLCLSHTFLNRLDDTRAATFSYLITLLVILLVAELSWRALDYFPAGADFYTSSHGSFLLKSLGIGAIVSALALRYFYVQHQWRDKVKQEAESRYQALQARIRPHFLFNCMNTIASLTRRDPRLAEESVEDLADLFRASLQKLDHIGSLAEEIDLCKRYLRIEQHRLGERLKIHWDIDNLPLQSKIPSLTIQPLLENAIYHGIEPMAKGGTIEIRGDKQADTWNLHIENPVAEDTAGQDRHQGNHFAQDNVRQRLRAHFGDAARLDISAEPGRYRLSLYIPHSL